MLLRMPEVVRTGPGTFGLATCTTGSRLVRDSQDVESDLVSSSDGVDTVEAILDMLFPKD